MSRLICFIDENGRSGTCTNYGNKGKCEECEFPKNKNEEKYTYLAWGDSSNEE